MTNKEASSLPIRQVVADPEWQMLRKSFLGTWRFTPANNVERLRNYIRESPDPLRLRRVHNYLTGSAFRTRQVSHPEIDSLLQEVRNLRQR